MNLKLNLKKVKKVKKEKLLNQQIQARHDPEAWAADGGIETEVDLMVDQLHELADT